VLQVTSQISIEVGFRVLATKDCFQQDCANQDVLAAYSDAINNSVFTGSLIEAIRDKATTIQEVASLVLQSGVLGRVSVEILELPSASPSREPSSLPSLEPSAFPNEDKKDKKDMIDKKDKKDKKETKVKDQKQEKQ
jgi:hypothetical protein